MIARLPPNACAMPPALSRPRTVNCLGPFDRLERDLAARLDVIAVGEVAGQDQGIGLRDEDQRVVDDVFVGVVEIVVAEAAVAGHIDGDDEQLALSFDAGLDFGFDDRARRRAPRGRTAPAPARPR